MICLRMSLLNALLLMLLHLAVNTVHALEFDGKSLLFARLPPATAQGNIPQAVFLKLNADSTQPAVDLQVPLGSVWKLFVYAYAVDRGLHMPEYPCRGGKLAKEELFCCNPGETITRDAALAKSCGLFFDPQRLQLDELDWQQYWQKKVQQVAWLSDLKNMQPATKISVSSLLQALSSIDGKVREQVETALLAVVLNGRGYAALSHLGGRYRVKTYTWDHPKSQDKMIGGAAGWLNDGSAVWFGALGSSIKVMLDFAPELARVAEQLEGNGLAGRCVDVAMFTRYPIKRLLFMPEGRELQNKNEAALLGQYQIEFVNGNTLRFRSNGEMQVKWQNGNVPLLGARLDENEYVARVIDREANTKDKEAARALSIVARTYLLQNARKQGECLLIADSSHTQRVSPSPASGAARAASLFTAGLVLQGVNAQYRLSSSAKNVLSWQKAVELAREGLRFDEILRLSFDSASLATIAKETECVAMPEAERWLKKQAEVWRKQLMMQPGFAEPRISVCMLQLGRPYSDMAQQRIYVRGLYGLNERITLAHEYLHLAFAGYPTGHDENYVEQWARRLIEGESGI